MRKFLMVAAIGTLAVLLAVPASALDFKFGAEYRVRFYDGVNGGNSGGGFQTVGIDAPGNNPRGVQLRVRPRFDVKDDDGNIQATLRLEIGDVEFGNGGGAAGQTNPGSTGDVQQGGARVGNGAGGGLGVDGVNVETKWAYIDAAFPLGIPARVRAGLQGWYLPKGLIMDDDAAGVRVYGTIKPLSYDLAWFRVKGGATTAPAVTTGGVAGTLTNVAGITTTSNTIDNNYDFYQAKADLALMPFFNPGVYYVYGRNATNSAWETATGDIPQLHFLGATVTGKAGIVAYDLDFVYGKANGGVNGAFPESTAGYAIDGAVHFPIGPVTLNFAATYGSGDKRDGGKSEAFPSIAASWNGPGGGFEMLGSGGPFDAVEFTQDAPTNIFALGAWVTYNPVKALTLKAAYAYAQFARKDGNCAATIAGNTNLCYGPGYLGVAGKKQLGHEVSFRADYQVWTGFLVQGQAAWFLTPSGLAANGAPAGNGKTAAEYVLQLLYNF